MPQTSDGLAAELHAARKEKNILLMTHIVLGYPSFEVNRQVIAQMVEAGVDIMELQIPFSEPMADGPTILKANQEALANGVTVADCLDFAAEMASLWPIPFLFMTYYNIVFRYGVEAFCRRAAGMGIRGMILPDLPPEEGGEFLAAMDQYALAPVQIFAPTSSEERMRTLAANAKGLIYCVARRGVTGKKTSFDERFSSYMARCRKATDLPLAVGFGIRNSDDLGMLQGMADIAVIGTETIRIVATQGPSAVGPFIRSLRCSP